MSELKIERRWGTAVAKGLLTRKERQYLRVGLAYSIACRHGAAGAIAEFSKRIEQKARDLEDDKDESS